MKLIIRHLAVLAYAFSAVALASTSISKVNGSVHVDEREQAGDVSTVNGSVTIGADAIAEDVETVNGSVRIDDRARTQDLETVNGAITVGANVQIEGGVSTVNGSLSLGQGSHVSGGLENVNGKMMLRGANVDGGIETVNGDIHLAANSRVLGGIHYEKNNSWHKSAQSHNPRLTIEQGAVIEGPLLFEREIDLYVAPGVNLPAINGVEPKRYTLK